MASPAFFQKVNHSGPEAAAVIGGGQVSGMQAVIEMNRRIMQAGLPEKIVQFILKGGIIRPF